MPELGRQLANLTRGFRQIGQEAVFGQRAISGCPFLNQHVNTVRFEERCGARHQTLAFLWPQRSVMFQELLGFAQTNPQLSQDWRHRRGVARVDPGQRHQNLGGHGSGNPPRKYLLLHAFWQHLRQIQSSERPPNAAPKTGRHDVNTLTVHIDQRGNQKALFQSAGA